MAHNLDDSEFWLPPSLDDSVTDFEKTRFFSSESNSGFSSPVDSVLDFTKTESDEDKFLNELTRRLTNSTHLSHNIWKRKTNTPWKMTTSPPQSTLCNEEVGSKNHAYRYSNQPILYHPQQQPNAKQRFAGKMQQTEVNGVVNSDSIGSLLSPSAWPTLQKTQSQSNKQPLPGSWTRSVILGNNNIIVNKRQCSGTGVFFPRPVAATPNETPRKKPVALKQRNSAVVLARAQQRRDIFRLPVSESNEIRLPQEWTY